MERTGESGGGTGGHVEIRESAVARTVKFERFISHFYLDTKNKVTIGVGQMIPDANSAVPLKLTIDGKAATDAQKKACWTTIKGKTPGQPADSYAKDTKCRMSEADAKVLLKERLQLAVSDLEKRFPALDKYPWDAQDALLDMMFNIGLTKFNETEWPSLFKAVRNKDWKTAATECSRKDVPEDRNAEIKQLFESAADIHLEPRVDVRQVASRLDELVRERMTDLRSLLEADPQRYFPGGVTKLVLRVELGGAKV